MQLKVYAEAGVFLERVRPILEKDEAANSLMLGTVSMAAENPGIFGDPLYLALVEDGEKIPLIAIKTPRFKLLPYSDTPSSLPDECLDLLAADLAARGLEMPGVEGLEELTSRFAPRWVAHRGGRLHQGKRLGVFELTEVTPPRPVPGIFRAAQPEDVALLTEWVVAFQEEALGQPPQGDVLGQVQRRIEAGNLFVWEDETDRVVTMAGRARPTRHGATVNSVYTPPELRGKGYASNCVAALSQFVLDSGKRFATLFTDLANPTSNSIYQKMGYKHLLDYDEIIFELL